MTFNVAILPSNQSANVSPIIPAYNEAGGMAWIAPLIVERCKARGINACWFPVNPETQPGQTKQHQWITEQIARANAWLKSVGGGVMVHLHTDSGDYSHTFGIYTTRFPNSQELARSLGYAVQQSLATAEFRTINKLGSIDYDTYLFATLAQHTSCLIELCAHTVERDIRVLYGQPQLAAEGIVTGLAAFAGIDPDEETIRRLTAENGTLQSRVTRLLARQRQAKGLLAIED